MAKGQWIDYPWFGGGVPAYLALPEGSTPKGGVLVIQELWGVDDHIQDVTRRVADLGYLALAPELFAAGNAPPELSKERIERLKAFLDSLPPGSLGQPGAIEEAIEKLLPTEGTQIVETKNSLFAKAADKNQIAILRSAVDWLRQNDAVRNKPLGSIGFCMGGALSGLLACRTHEMAATVVFYGSAPALAEVHKFHGRLLGLYGADDPRITGGVGPFSAELTKYGVKHETVVYPDTPHAFFNDTRPSYRAEAAQDAWKRVRGFFKETLG